MSPGAQAFEASDQAWPGVGALPHDHRLLRPAEDIREILWAHGSEVLSSEQNVCRAIHEDICGDLQHSPQTRDREAEVR